MRIIESTGGEAHSVENRAPEKDLRSKDFSGRGETGVFSVVFALDAETRDERLASTRAARALDNFQKYL